MKLIKFSMLIALCVLVVFAVGCKNKAQVEQVAVSKAEKTVAKATCNNPYDAKIVFSGPGGHSNGAYGRTNALHAASTAVENMFMAEAPKGIVFNVNTIFGGNSVNSIAGGATVVVESCGDTPAASEAFVKYVKDSVDKGIATENAFRGIKTEQTDAAGVRLDIRAEITKM